MRTYLILLFVTTIANSFLFCQDPEVLLAEANSKMEIGELELADSLLRESLKIDPSFAPAVVAQSKLWLRKGEIKKAIPLAENAVNLDGEFRSWATELDEINKIMMNAMSTYKQGNTDLAFNELQSLTEKYPYFSQPYYNIGYMKFKLKDPEGMTFYAREVLKIYPNHEKGNLLFNNGVKYFYQVGNQAYKRGDLEKAITNFSKAIEYDENFVSAYFQLGVIEKKMGNSDKAINYFNKIISIDPQHYKTWFTFGVLLETNNQLDSAMSKYKRAIEIKPEFIKPYSSLGNLYTKNGDYISAKEILSMALQKESDNSNIYLMLGIAFSEEAKKFEDESTQKGIDSKVQVALLSKSKKLFTSAVDNLKKAIDYGNKNYFAWYKYSSALNSIENYKDASLAAQKCIDLKNNFGGGWYERGIAEWEGGKAKKKGERAKKYFNEANKYRDFRAAAQDQLYRINHPLKFQK